LKQRRRSMTSKLSNSEATDSWHTSTYLIPACSHKLLLAGWPWAFLHTWCERINKDTFTSGMQECERIILAYLMWTYLYFCSQALWA